MLTLLFRRRKHSLDGEVFEILSVCTDFISFKEMILDFKTVSYWNNKFHTWSFKNKWFLIGQRRIRKWSDVVRITIKYVTGFNLACSTDQVWVGKVRIIFLYCRAFNSSVCHYSNHSVLNEKNVVWRHSSEINPNLFQLYFHHFIVCTAF